MNAGCDLAYFMFKKEGGKTSDTVVFAEADIGTEEVKLFEVVSMGDVLASRKAQGGAGRGGAGIPFASLCHGDFLWPFILVTFFAAY